jgi:hypothetical protein
MKISLSEFALVLTLLAVVAAIVFLVLRIMPITDVSGVFRPASV